MNRFERQRIDWALELAQSALGGSVWAEDGTKWDVESTPLVEIAEARKMLAERWRWGILFRLGSCWIGAHYAPHNKRLCINLVPFITIWITAPGGRVP